jgi:HlyD family secretion protein
MLHVPMERLTSRVPRLKGLLMSTSPGHSRLWIAAVVVLAVATVGANWYLYFRDSGHGARLTSDNAEDPTASRAQVVCFGHVDVEYGVQSLYPLQPGRVKEVLVHDAARVKSGKALLHLDDSQAKNVLREAEADLKAAVAQREQARLAREQHEAKGEQQDAAIKAARSRHSAAKNILARKQQLRKANQLSAEEVQAASDQADEAKAGLDAELAKKTELDLAKPQLVLDRAEADVLAKEARRDQAQQAVDECTLRAPADGEVLRVLVGPGDVLGPQPKQPAILFCPKKPLLIRAEVSQEFAGRVHVGQPAWIQDDTDATQTWKGKVVRVSRWYTHRRSIMQEPLQLNDVRTLECIVAFDDPDPPVIRIGQRMRITIGDEPEK